MDFSSTRPPVPWDNPFRLDEGYSEETRSQSAGSDTIMRSDAPMDDHEALIPPPPWFINMTEAQKLEFTWSLLRTLRTSSIASMVRRVYPMLHLDPVQFLPPEITFQIFSYLEPDMLLRASTLSKAWRNQILDSQLWKRMFEAEGWQASISQIRRFEEMERARKAEMNERKQKGRRPVDREQELYSNKKRAAGGSLFGSSGPVPLSLSGFGEAPEEWAEQHGMVEADGSPSSGSQASTSDDRMDEDSPLLSPAAVRTKPAKIQRREPLFPPVTPSLLLPSDTPQINWQFLFKQRRKLEENWDAGRYVNFQLPHPNHPEEAHTECVYTLQYSGNYLVSGSRDKSVRIWDLERQRLLLPPLVGHSASVLCLQFDERPGQDVVISGGSDCHIIIWQFSTGRLLKRLDKAHSESVLNLRFDERFLVSCSKDKTIKVWNRRAITPADQDYPKSTSSGARFPSYIINMEHVILGDPTTKINMKPLKEYSLLMTLEGHTAAVNAIQILGDEIVSASGDRTIKVWDTRTGVCLKTINGHHKGIACVQFDGRRIVSGSSDETVRIFDRATGAEVGLLKGHSNLVRTVQAQFGDIPGHEDDLEAEAREVDRQYYEARARGLVSDQMTREQRRARNNGSTDPNKICALGAKLPPGGGGSRWARIVSGSYDETVIIWRRVPQAKDRSKGEWVVKRILFQSEAVRAAGGRLRRRLNNPDGQTHLAHLQPHHGPVPIPTALQHAQGLAHMPQTTVTGPQAAFAPTGALQQAPANPLAPHLALHAHPPANTNNNNLPHPQPPHPHAGIPAPQQQPQLAPPHPPFPHPPVAPSTNQSRVFKLQFDARRIICCSQDPTIVGWDFANGDPEIVAASRFFGESS